MSLLKRNEPFGVFSKFSAFLVVLFKLDPLLSSTWTIRADLESEHHWWFGPMFQPDFVTAGQQQRVWQRFSMSSANAELRWMTHMESTCAAYVTLNGLSLVTARLSHLEARRLWCSASWFGAGGAGSCRASGFLELVRCVEWLQSVCWASETGHRACVVFPPFERQQTT